ncbi:MAG: hypothetical protein K6G30_03515, partial [Acetatifactor sp.]|nr:hypothetical protein [Acetatifactor sp.]
MKKRAVILQYILLVCLVAASVCAIGPLKKSLAQKADRELLAASKVILYDGTLSLKDATEEDIKNTAENNRDFTLMHCTDTEVLVNGQECYVYDTNVNHTRSWVSSYYPPQSRTPIAYFDFEGTVEVQVKVPNIELESVKVSPLSYEIEPTIDAENHTVTFRVDTPDTYTVQFNDAPERAVHIFAYAIEKEEEIPDADDPNVIYIGPGEWD